MPEIQSKTAYEGWAILELMGHRRMAGYVSEAEQYGTVMLRIDVQDQSDKCVTQFYGGSAIYCVTPTTEDVARRMAERSSPAPVSAYDLAPSRSPEQIELADEDDFRCPNCGSAKHAHCNEDPESL